jgi:hypothetical protein
LFNQLSEAYDRVCALAQSYPSAEFRVNPEDEASAKKLASDYNEYAKLLLEKILRLEVDLCLSKSAT